MMKLINILFLSFCLFVCFSSVGQSSALSDEDKIKKIYSLYGEFHGLLKNTPEVDPRDKLPIFENAIFVDVRDDDELKISQIKNAIPVRQFKKNIEEYKNKKIIVYCTIGYRSGLYAKKLRSQGFDAYNLKGGILLWAHSSRDITANGKPTKSVHIYGKKWDLLPQGWLPFY